MTYEEAKEIYKGCTRGSRGHRKWPDSYSIGDCDFLSIFYLEISDEDLAFILGRSEKSILVKRLCLGLCRPRGYKIPPLEGEKKIIEKPEPEKPVEKASFRDECRAKGMSYAEMQIAERLMQAKKDLSLSEFTKRQSTKRSTLSSDGDVYFRCFEQVELMQSTGLFDKNGVEIFEGDIVENTTQRVYLGHRFEVSWNGGYACFQLLNGGKSSNVPLIQDFMSYEVVGNIYKNPELLEVEE